VVSSNGVWRVRRRHGPSRRMSRLSLVAGYAAPPGPEPVEPPLERHVEVDHPGELVGFDCFPCRAPVGIIGSGLAVHRDRPRELLRVGRAAHHAPQPVGGTHLGPREARGRGPARAWVAPRTRVDRQRIGVPLVRFRVGRARHGCGPDVHPGAVR
jgi:hypothetical protein